MHFLPSRYLLAFVFLLHAVVGVYVGLSVDEAHYLLYAQHPALSYFDHPPLVGWVQWPLVELLAPVGLIRLLAGLLWVATALLVQRLAMALSLRSGGDSAHAQHAGWWALLALAASPILHVLGLALLPDTLLMALTAALMLQTLRLMDAAKLASRRDWLLLGVLLGLAGLAKYTAIFAALAVGFCLLWAHGWRLLRQPWLWVCTLLAIAMVTPVLIWNAQNHWISFVYQAQHGAGGAWRASHVLRFALLQLLAFGPLLLWGLLSLRMGQRAIAPLLAFGVVPLAILSFMAGGGSSLPHWGAPAWVAFAPFAALGLAGSWQAGAWRRWLLGGLLALQVAACAALLGLMLSAGQPWFAGKASNPFADLHGWDAAGLRARALARDHGLTAMAVQNWTLGSRTGWYARQYTVHVLQARYDQFDIWSGDLKPDTGVLLLDWSMMPYAPPVGAQGFRSCDLLDKLETVRWGTRIAHFSFYRCIGWQGAPKASPK